MKDSGRMPFSHGNSPRLGHILLRRFVHMSAPAFLVYYWLPSEMFGYRKWALLLALLVIIGAFEVYRLMAKVRIPGMRDYESRRISAAMWAALAIVLVFLTLPVEAAAAGLGVLALSDPLAGKTRGKVLYPLAPILGGFVFALILLFFIGIPVAYAILMALSSSLAGTAAEAPRTHLVDDDFRTLVAASFAAYLVEIIFLY